MTLWPCASFGFGAQVNPAWPKTPTGTEAPSLFLSNTLFPAVYPESLKKRPQGVSWGQAPPTWQAEHFWPVWRANDGNP